jgi:hypothetical protein
MEEYILKSKIKEKIEELEKLRNEHKGTRWEPEIRNTIYHIQELLEDK